MVDPFLNVPSVYRDNGELWKFSVMVDTLQMCSHKSKLEIVWLNFSPPFFRATLYVGKYSTSLYASPSLVHDGVTVVVSGSYTYIFI